MTPPPTRAAIHPTDLEALTALREAGIFRLSQTTAEDNDNPDAVTDWWHGIANCSTEHDNDDIDDHRHHHAHVSLLNLGSCRLHRGFGTLTANDLRRIFGTQLTRLASLNLGGTNARMTDVLTILEATRTAPLECLYLGGNGVGPHGAALLAQFIVQDNDESSRTMIHLRKLDLRYNDIGPTGCAALCEALLAVMSSSSNATATTAGLTQLYLEGNDIGNDGATALAKLLQSPACTIQEVFLGANNIGPHGAQALATALRHNACLEKLYIEGNQIGPEGAEAFTQALSSVSANEDNETKQSRLKHLYCDNNGIGKEESQRLAQALSSETAIGESLFE